MLKKFISLSILFSGIVFLLLACSGGSSGGTGNGNSNSAPVANAGSDKNVAAGSLVTLDGSGSSDADGDTLTYKWTLTSVPSGSGASLADSTAINPTFTADVDGNYVVSLVVNDGTVDSAADSVTIAVLASGNHTPTADAGTDRSVITGSLVTLDGSGSSDADGDTLTYAWTLTSVPSGSGASLSNPTAVNPAFTADVDGDYALSLVVSDGVAGSAADTVTITAFTTSSSIPDTGQAVCYDSWGYFIDCTGTGQDGEYSINPMSYTDNGDGTVTDNVTGLMWQQVDDNSAYNWYKASGIYDATYNPGTEDVCGSLTLGGHGDWRLPDVTELLGIVDFGVDSIPFIAPIDETAFPNTPAAGYWTSTEPSAFPGESAYVTFTEGYPVSAVKNADLNVRCVRGVQQSIPDLIDNGDATVTDNITGLLWQKEDDGATKTWVNALAYCNALSLAGHNDWRLPNIKELWSLIDLSKNNPAISAVFPNTGPYYWSSTTYSDTGLEYDAWYAGFTTGGIYVEDKGYSNVGQARCVR